MQHEKTNIAKKSKRKPNEDKRKINVRKQSKPQNQQRMQQISGLKKVQVK